MRKATMVYESRNALPERRGRGLTWSGGALDAYRAARKCPRRRPDRFSRFVTASRVTSSKPTRSPACAPEWRRPAIDPTSAAALGHRLAHADLIRRILGRDTSQLQRNRIVGKRLRSRRIGSRTDAQARGSPWSTTNRSWRADRAPDGTCETRHCSRGRPVGRRLALECVGIRTTVHPPRPVLPLAGLRSGRLTACACPPTSGFQPHRGLSPAWSRPRTCA